MTIERLSLNNPDCIVSLSALVDEGCNWNDERGASGFLTAHRLQRVVQHRAEVLRYEIAVDERFHRRGIAAAMIAPVKRWAAEVGADEGQELIYDSNHPAKALDATTGGEEFEPGVRSFSYRIDPVGSISSDSA